MKTLVVVLIVALSAVSAGYIGGPVALVGPAELGATLKGPAASASVIGPDGSSIASSADSGAVVAAPVAPGVVSAAVAPALVAAAPPVLAARTIIGGPSGIISGAGYPYGLVNPAARIVAPGVGGWGWGGPGLWL